MRRETGGISGILGQTGPGKRDRSPIRIRAGRRRSARNRAGAQPHRALLPDQRLCPRDARPRGGQRSSRIRFSPRWTRATRKARRRSRRPASTKPRPLSPRPAKHTRPRRRGNPRPKPPQIWPARRISAIRSCLNPAPCRLRKWMKCECGATPARRNWLPANPWSPPPGADQAGGSPHLSGESPGGPRGRADELDANQSSFGRENRRTVRGCRERPYSPERHCW